MKELLSKEDLASKIDWEGGLGEVIFNYAGPDFLEEYDVSVEACIAWRNAFFAMEALKLVLGDEGVVLL